jgi:hypothetical protein
MSCWSEGNKKKLLVSFGLISVSILLGAHIFLQNFMSERTFDDEVDCPNTLFKFPKLPQDEYHQRVFSFKHMTFSSLFESGNLKDIRKLKSNHYSLMIGSDPAGSTHHSKKKNWFYFSAKSKHSETQKVKFYIHNLQYNWSMWKNGMVPAYKSAIATNNTWSLLDTSNIKLIMKSKNIIMQFHYNFTAGEEVEFALSFPYTLGQSQAFIEETRRRLLNETDIYFAKETLIKTNQNRNVDLLVLSSGKNITKFSIPKLKNLFPDRNQTLAPETAIKLFSKHKKVVIISARVHPSETASSYMFEGFLNTFLNKTQEVQEFLDEHVLVMIPVLNPDGVVNGFTRSDVNGLNLNANYKLADLNTPSIYALKKMIRYMNQRNGVNFYLDFHSHFTKRAFFLFGNPIRQKNYRRILRFPFLVKNNEPEFSISNSKFGSDKSDESTSRKEIYKYTKLKQIYTVEANYWGNVEDLRMLKNKKLIQNNLRIINDFKNFYRIDDFRRFGEKIAKSLIQNWRITHGKMRNLRRNLHTEIDAYYKNLARKKIRQKNKVIAEASILRHNSSVARLY